MKKPWLLHEVPDMLRGSEAVPPRLFDTDDLEELATLLSAGGTHRIRYLLDLGSREVSWEQLLNAPDPDLRRVTVSAGQGASLTLGGRWSTISAQGSGGIDVGPVLMRYRQLGQPISDPAFAIIAMIWAALAVALVSLAWAFIGGGLTLWLLPAVLVLMILVAPEGRRVYVQRIDSRRELRSLPVLDRRPREQVRLDREQRRQRIQTALIFGSITAVIWAAAGVLLKAAFE